MLKERGQISCKLMLAPEFIIAYDSLIALHFSPINSVYISPEP